MEKNSLINRNYSKLFAILAIFISVSFAFGQDEDAQNAVDARLKIAEEAITKKGFSKSHNFRKGSLKEEEVKSLNIELEAGVGYVFVGVCDKDCSDVDMRLLDSNNKVIDIDTKDDNHPILAISPKETETFVVEIKMRKCTAVPCYYGIGVFSNENDSTGAEPTKKPTNDKEKDALLRSWIKQVTDKLDEIKKLVYDEGELVKTHDYIVRNLKQNNQESVTIDLSGGKKYMITGVCDLDCSDLDLIVYDSDGKQVDSDLKEGGLPILVVKPRRDDKYKIFVKMEKCKASPCLYGIGIFGK